MKTYLTTLFGLLNYFKSNKGVSLEKSISAEHL